MIFHFKWKSREIRFDKGWNSVLSQKQQTCGELILVVLAPCII